MKNHLKKYFIKSKNGNEINMYEFFRVMHRYIKVVNEKESEPLYKKYPLNEAPLLYVGNIEVLEEILKVEEYSPKKIFIKSYVAYLNKLKKTILINEDFMQKTMETYDYIECAINLLDNHGYKLEKYFKSNRPNKEKIKTLEDINNILLENIEISEISSNKCENNFFVEESISKVIKNIIDIKLLIQSGLVNTEMWRKFSMQLNDLELLLVFFNELLLNDNSGIVSKLNNMNDMGNLNFRYAFKSYTDFTDSYKETREILTLIDESFSEYSKSFENNNFYY